MLKRFAILAGIACFAASTLLADFSYQETSTVTGGMMASMLKFAGAFSKQAKEPIRSTVAVKGDKMVHKSQTSATVIDLGSETITSIDIQKKTYSVMTFDEMRKLIEQTSQAMKSKDGAQMQVKVSAKNTGATKQVAGFDAKELILKMEMEAQNQENGAKGGMTVTTDMWIASGVSGYAEVRDFQKRMAEKLNWSPGGNMFMSNPDVAKGMAEVAKEMSKLDGVPVLQYVSMGAAGMPQGTAPQENAGGSPRQARGNGPSAEDEAGRAGDRVGKAAADEAGHDTGQALGGGRVANAVGGSVGSALGRFGGFGRKKKEEAKPEPKAEAPAEQASPAAPPKAAGSGSLLEMTVEMSAFSTGSVDGSTFDVPAGFKKVDSDLKKMK